MSKDIYEELYGKGDAPAPVAPTAPPPEPPPPGEADASLLADVDEPEGYRPYVIRSRGQMNLAVITADGARHGFSWHRIDHPHHRERRGKEVLTFTAGVWAVSMVGTGLALLWVAMQRGVLIEAREWDGKQPRVPMPLETAGPVRLPPTVIEALDVRMVPELSAEERAEFFG